MFRFTLSLLSSYLVFRCSHHIGRLLRFLGLFALLQVGLVTEGGAAWAQGVGPGRPVIDPLAPVVATGATFMLHWNMNWGSNGDRWSLLDNGNIVGGEHTLSPNGQNPQHGEQAITASQTGVRNFQIRLCMSTTCTLSQAISITVTGTLQNAGVSPPVMSWIAPGSLVIGQPTTLSADSYFSSNSPPNTTATNAVFKSNGMPIATVPLHTAAIGSLTHLSARTTFIPSGAASNHTLSVDFCSGQTNCTPSAPYIVNVLKP
jgi:hypothetical protein